MALLNEGGMPALTLRRAAARAGVSHAAPAWHFDGLPGLLTAIAARAFADFAGRMEQARDAAGSDRFLRLHGLCQGYLDFARINPGLFHVMFVSAEVDRGAAALTPHSRRAYMLLRETCLPFASDGSEPDLVLETAVWSLVHGFATLQFTALPPERQVFGQSPDFRLLLRALIAGQQMQG